VQAGGRKIVIITGEAGIGKSALFRHFRAQVAASKSSWIEATCRPEHSFATLQPIRELLRHALPKVDMDWLTNATLDSPPPSQRLADFDKSDRQLLLRFFNADADGTRPASSATTPIGDAPPVNRPDWPSDRQFRLVNLLVEIISHVAATQPTVLAIEDLHWADGETLKFLGLLAERSAHWRQFGLALVTRRRDVLPYRVTQAATMIVVERLSDSEIVELLMPTGQLARRA
jgi:predicted ATPase